MAWTITVSHDESMRFKHSLGGDRMEVVKLACVSDGSGGSVTLRSTNSDPANDYNEIMDAVKNSWLYLIESVPGTGGDVPSATFDFDIENKRNGHILDIDDFATAPTGGSEFKTGADFIGVYPPVFDDLTVVIATLGDGNKADFYLYFLK